MRKKAIYRSPQTEVVTVCESEMLCTSIADGGSALENSVTDGDSRLYESSDEFAIFGMR
jgi:hypothetical protein